MLLIKAVPALLLVALSAVSASTIDDTHQVQGNQMENVNQESKMQRVNPNTTKHKGPCKPGQIMLIMSNTLSGYEGMKGTTPNSKALKAKTSWKPYTSTAGYKDGSGYTSACKSERQGHMAVYNLEDSLMGLLSWSFNTFNINGHSLKGALQWENPNGGKVNKNDETAIAFFGQPEHDNPAVGSLQLDTAVNMGNRSYVSVVIDSDDGSGATPKVKGARITALSTESQVLGKPPAPEQSIP